MIPTWPRKMKAEIEGIFLWAFAGLQRLVANNFKFTESQRTRENREAVKRDNNNVFDFLESEGLYPAERRMRPLVQRIATTFTGCGARKTV